MDTRGRLLEALFIFPVSFMYTCIHCLICQKHLKVCEILLIENILHVHLRKFIFFKINFMKNVQQINDVRYSWTYVFFCLTSLSFFKVIIF